MRALALVMLLTLGQTNPKLEQQARQVVEELSAGAFEKVTARMRPSMAEALPAPKLAEAWKDATAPAGKLAGVEGAKVDTRATLTAVVLTARFGRAPLQVRVVFDEDGKIAGLFFPGADAEAVTRELVGKLAARKFSEAAATFTPEMAAALPADKLEAVWSQTEAQHGRFEDLVRVHEEPAGKLRLGLAHAAFANGPLGIKVAVDRFGRVAGLFFVPADAVVAAPAWSPPAYAKPEAFEEREVAVKSGEVALPATLTLPKGEGPFPAVVLVHGSGPNDRDETVDGRKLFKDLAWGLASRGVAVLRYDKRTRVSPAGVRTVKEEVLDGARGAVDALYAEPKVDRSRLVVAGHSQGGLLGPRIAASDPRVKGLALLAGPSRPEPELWVEQAAYLSGGDAREVEQAEAAARAFWDPKLDAKGAVEVFGAKLPGEYVLDLRRYDARQTAAGLKIPVLVLQGARDYQVRVTDYLGWKQALAHRPNARFKLYPGLDHLFGRGEGIGLSLPADYRRPEHAPEELVADLASFAAGLGSK